MYVFTFNSNHKCNKVLKIERETGLNFGVLNSYPSNKNNHLGKNKQKQKKKHLSLLKINDLNAPLRNAQVGHLDDYHTVWVITDCCFYITSNETHKI